jgi:hypothetical protein
MVGEVFRFVGKRNRAIVQLYNEIVLKKKKNNFIERLEKGRERERKRERERSSKGFPFFNRNITLFTKSLQYSMNLLYPYIILCIHDTL